MNQLLDSQVVFIHPLSQLEKRADLVFFDGPLLSLFENRDGEPFLFLWADVDDRVNRWIVVRVSPERLAAYLRRSVPLRDLILNPGDGYLFVADMPAPDEFAQVYLVSPSDLPTDYVPASDSYYAFTPLHGEVDLLALATRYRTPLLDVHLLRGKGIHFGTADVITLGSMLRSTGELAEAVAVSLFSGDANNEKLNRETARSYGQFEYVTQRAASFSAILRPLVTQENIEGFADRTNEVVSVVLSLLNGTPDYPALQKAAEQYSDGVIRKLESFAAEVEHLGIAVELRWAAPGGGVVASAQLDPIGSGKIVSNINRLESEEVEGFWARGTFLAVDTKRRTYRFESVAGRESTGTFDPRMSFPVTHISFEIEYTVYMNRKTAKVSGRSKPRVVEVIGDVVPADELRLDTSS